MFESKRIIEKSTGDVSTSNRFFNITEGDMMNRHPGFDIGLGIEIASSSSQAANQQNQGVAALLVMLAVLCFIFAYCCWGAPYCRNLCKKYCCCRLEDPESADISRFGSNERTAMVATPTIILLPHGRMLVVDGTVFNQFQADNTGLDLVQLGEHAIRGHMNNPRTLTRHQLHCSQGSGLTTDGESLSKDSLEDKNFPPTYESIYGKGEGSVPPSYSDILLHRFATLPYDIDVIETYNGSKEELEMRSFGSAGSCRHIIQNPINNPYTMINNRSSHSIACANLSRNSSLISNPLDGYYLSNEMGCFRFEQDIVNSQSYLNINNISSFYNQINSNSREQLERNERVCSIGSLPGESNVPSEPRNSRNIARDEPESNFKLEVDSTFRNLEKEDQNLQDCHLSSDDSIALPVEENCVDRSQMADSEESSDFQVLPDIRESRV